jgi:PAS domain S-box-containing protein
LPDTTLTFVNQAYCRFFGRQREELIGQKFLTLNPPAARHRVVRNIAGLTRNRPTETHEHEVVLPDGSVGWQQWVNHALIGADGQVREFQSIGRDITERVRIERALRESEERITLATESANLGLWVYRPEQDVVWMSEKGREIYGVGRDEPLSPKSFLRCIPPDEHEAVRNAFAPAQPRQDALEIEHRIVKPGGATSWVITRGRFLHDDHGKLMELIGVTIDITAQKQAALQQQATREEMAHLTRIAAIGEIAVSLAHELTQPLTGIMGNADAGRRLLEGGSTDLRELREILVDIKTDVSRAGDVVHGIRRMGRKGRTIREPVNLNEIVKSVIGLLKPELLLHRCELKTSLEHDLPVIEGDPTELQQVLINLVVNSLDAMRQTPAHERQVAIATKWNGKDSIEASVRDRGAGIPDEARAQLFEKFFTTKPEGLGMGLAITRSIIQSHGGMITGENVAGGGAQFSFVLPAKADSS